MLRQFLAALAAIVLVACATPSPQPERVIERLSPEDLARMAPQPEPKLALTELVRLSKDGMPAAEVIERIKSSGSRYALSAAQMIDLHQQGVSAQVLDYIRSAQDQALRDRLAEEINQREARHAEELRRERESCRCYYDPWWPGYGHPYGPRGYWRR